MPGDVLITISQTVTTCITIIADQQQVTTENIVKWSTLSNAFGESNNYTNYSPCTL